MLLIALQAVLLVLWSSSLRGCIVHQKSKPDSKKFSARGVNLIACHKSESE